MPYSDCIELPMSMWWRIHSINFPFRWSISKWRESTYVRKSTPRPMATSGSVLEQHSVWPSSLPLMVSNYLTCLLVYLGKNNGILTWNYWSDQERTCNLQINYFCVSVFINRSQRFNNMNESLQVVRAVLLSMLLSQKLISKT